jgi:hypothetical protein
LFCHGMEVWYQFTPFGGYNGGGRMVWAVFWAIFPYPGSLEMAFR